MSDIDVNIHNVYTFYTTYEMIIHLTEMEKLPFC